MAKTQTMHMRIDETLKNDADLLFEQLGMSTTDAITVFLKQALYYGGFPFEVRVPKFNETTENALKEAKNIAKNGNFRFSSVEEMKNSLENDNA